MRSSNSNFTLSRRKSSGFRVIRQCVKESILNGLEFPNSLNVLCEILNIRYKETAFDQQFYLHIFCPKQTFTWQCRTMHFPLKTDTGYTSVASEMNSSRIRNIRSSSLRGRLRVEVILVEGVVGGSED